jgi:hypothetical protein
MKNSLILLFALLFSTSVAEARNPKTPPKREYNNAILEADDYTIKMENIVSVGEETKFKLTIINKTGNFMLYKPKESTFIIAEDKYTVSEKNLVIPPNESNSKTIFCKGKDLDDAHKFTFNIGGLYSISLSDTAAKFPNFRIPPNKSEYNSGPFRITYSNYSWSTVYYVTKFDIAYSGKDVGIFYENRVGLFMPDGNNIMVKKPGDPEVLLKGEATSIKMNFSNNRKNIGNGENFVVWNDAFVEGKLNKIEVAPIKVVSE